MNVDLSPYVIPLVSVVVAVITGLSLLVVRLVRGPVEVKELWGETRSLRKDLDEARNTINRMLEHLNQQYDISRVMGEGFDAASNVIERLDPSPMITRGEHMAMSKAREMRNNDVVWDTLSKLQLSVNPPEEASTP